MSGYCFRILAVLICCSQIALSDERIVVGNDGSVAGLLGCGSLEKQAMVLQFSLPQAPAARMWREGAVLRGLWITNGIRYTQTILASASLLKKVERNGDARSSAVLLVNIEGENTIQARIIRETSGTARAIFRACAPSSSA